MSTTPPPPLRPHTRQPREAPHPGNTPTPQAIKLADIGLDKGTQIRQQYDDEAIEEYAARYAEGLPMPPVEIMTDGAENFLVDGFHRYLAAQKAGLTELEALIETGDVRQAILKACGANATHGVRRTNADKRRAVVILLSDPEWNGWSDRAIGTACNVDHKTVSAARASLPETGEFPILPGTRVTSELTTEGMTPDEREAFDAEFGAEFDAEFDAGFLALEETDLDAYSDDFFADDFDAPAIVPREEHGVFVRCPDHAHAVQLGFDFHAAGHDCYVWGKEK